MQQERRKIRPNITSVSVARVKDAFLPIGSVAPSRSPGSSPSGIGSMNGSVSTEGARAMRVLVELTW